jgi:uncharacterized membrane protein
MESGMSDKTSLVAVFENHGEAEQAVQELQRSGFDMKKLSIIGKASEAKGDAAGTYATQDRTVYWGLSGAFWGGMWGALTGSAFFLIPGVGPLLAVGPVVLWMVAICEDAAVVCGVSVIAAALSKVGIHKHSIPKYEAAVKSGKIVLIAHGTSDEVSRAKNTLDQERMSGSMLHIEGPHASTAQS